ncbi:5-keto-4-deoxy-D-glucarate aldolase [Serratia rubidaea]|uniref:5-keto-4-deoxy-D-glucarate aldolase n=1 Tax=Serratia rubidaea TaxID=61652 RepID=A0A3S4I2A9_SERRU|nr:5-keto-4-deoxy-D-glucarate aldolase [Serratia rubidaea]
MLDGEHAPNDITTFVPQLMALKGSSSAAVVRPPCNEPVIIKRLLDIGFFNFLIPFVESEEQALQAVASTRYPPAGIRGVSVSHRSNGYGTVSDYFSTVNDHISVLVQIESQAGIDHLDAIAAVDGVDGIFVGPGDLSAALGYLGQPNHPRYRRRSGISLRARRRRANRAAFWRRPKPMRAATWSGARPLSPSAAIWACCAVRRRRCATVLNLV